MKASLRSNGYGQKITIPFISVISIFLEDTAKKHYGSEICDRTSLQSGTIYPLLAGLVKNKWLKTEWETTDPIKSTRPRKLYSLTKLGKRKSIQLLSEKVSPVFADAFDNEVAAV